MSMPTTTAGRELLSDTSYHNIDCDVLATRPSACTCGLDQRIHTIEEESGSTVFRSLVDRARANHARWEHEADLLEECTRTLCLGAKVLLWPRPDDPDYQP